MQFAIFIGGGRQGQSVAPIKTATTKIVAVLLVLPTRKGVAVAQFPYPIQQPN